MQITATTKDAYYLLHEGSLAFARAEQVGLRIDVEYCERQKIILDKKINRLKTKFEETKFGQRWKQIYGAKFNLNSNPQLSYCLYKVLKIEPVKLTDTGMGSTDEEALSSLEMPELDLLLQIRKLMKVKDTYLDSLVREQVRGVVHPFFNLHTVRTYRSSSDRPNFQNIPKRDKESQKIVRGAIYPRPGHQLLEVDYSGIEVRIAGVYTQDEKLIYDTVHGDMHTDMAIELYMLDSLNKHHSGEAQLRQGAKNGFVFPQFYGDYYGNCVPNLLKWAKDATLEDGTPALVHLNDKGLVKLTKTGKLRNSDKFTDHVKQVEDQFWNDRYRKYTEWKEKTWRRYQKTGYVEFLSGFRCSGVMRKNEVLNTPIQGTAFHCLLWSFIQVDKLSRKEKWDTKLIGQIHDSMLLDVNPKELNEVAKKVQDISCNELSKAWPWLNVPLEVEAEICPVDRPWADKTDWEIPNNF